MKVVLFCGGFGMRLREYSDETPKPMVKIGANAPKRFGAPMASMRKDSNKR